MPDHDWTPDEMMTIVAARHFRNHATCFVGVGTPSVAACLARSLDAPDIVLLYESGVVGAKPTVSPLSIADGELAETADAIVSVPEFFSYWLQGGRIDMAFLGTAQIDRFGNLNTTVAGDYLHPKVRLPGGGGAPEGARSSKEVVVLVKQSARTFVEKLDFVTTVGRGKVKAVITDMCVLRPDAETGELTLVARHPHVSIDEVRAATAWPLRISDTFNESVPPTTSELAALRDLESRTRMAHESEARLLKDR